jgi:HEAT repeat protein
MESMPHAATGVLKQLGLAIKASTLYPSSHPGSVQYVEALLNALHAYMKVYGAFSVTAGKRKLTVDGLAIDNRTSTDLAYFLYSRRLVEFTVTPAVNRAQLAAFVSIVGMERTKLEEAGGVAHLLNEAGVEEIQVRELTLDAEDEVRILGLDVFFGLLERGRLSPQERAQVLEILRTGSEQAARLLQNIYELAGEVLDGITADDQVRHVCQAIRSLDRLIMDEPFDEHVSLYTNLAEGTLLLEEPPGLRPVHALLSGARDDVTAQVILDHLSSEHLAKIALQLIGDSGNVVEQVVTIMRGWELDRDKASSILSLIESNLPRQRKDGGSLSDAVLREIKFPSPGAIDEASAGFEFDKRQIAVSEEELERCLREARMIDEAGAIREAVKTFVDILANETEEEEMVDAAEALAGNLSWLVEQREFSLLRKILQDVKAIGSTAEVGRAEVVNRLLKRLTEGPFLGGLLTAIWEGRATPVEEEIRACMAVLAGELVGPLVKMLGAEPRAGMRAMLCELIAHIGPNHVDVLGTFITDPRWYLIRNIADIFGRMRIPQGVVYLAQLVQHWDSRVRTQTVDALVRIGTEDAQVLICKFLDDPEEKVRLRALRSLSGRGMQVAMPTLLALLEMRDPFNRLFELREAGIEAVARLGARDALPILQNLARARIVFGRRGHKLRRLARMAITIIEETSTDDQAVVLVEEGLARVV